MHCSSLSQACVLALLTSALPTPSVRAGESLDPRTLETRNATDGVPAIALRQVAELWADAEAAATVLNVSVQSNGLNVVTASPGAVVRYEVVGLLSDDLNEGLALLGFDLIFNGGALAHADIPVGEPTPGCDNPMINFTRPWGITNPVSPCPAACGFGGTIINGVLVQVGGGQNTILNTSGNAPFPIGPVLTGVAQPGSCGPAVLATGVLNMPMQPGTYTLILRNLFANVIRAGETGDPFWATEAAGVGPIADLTVVVTDTAVVPTVSTWGIFVLGLSLFTLHSAIRRTQVRV